MATLGVATWSLTAATNATADPAVNWAEGQAPSTVNDSARGMMQSVAKWRDDLGGVGSTGGTSTAYTIATNQTFVSLAALSGKRITVTPHTASGASPTLAVDGLTAKNLVFGAANVGAGDLLAANPYDVLYNVGTDKFNVMGVVGGGAFASGTSLPFFQAAAPTGWTKSTANTDAALRITSGTGGGTGGTANFTTAFAARTIARANLPNTDFMQDGAGNIPIISDSAGGAETTKGMVTSSATLAGTQAGIPGAPFSVPKVSGHIYLNGNITQTTMDFAVKYLDCIICTKN